MSFVDSFLRAVPRVPFTLVALLTSTVLVVGGLSGVAWAEDEGPAKDAEAAITSSDDSDGDGDLDRPDTTSASVTARLLKKSVEDLSQRTETDRVFALPNGTWRLQSHTVPVRVQQDEKWVDVDYDLVEQPDGSWAPKASPVDIVVDGGGAKEAARLTFDDGESLALTWPEALPKPTVDGGVATYELSESTDLVVTVTGRGVEAHIRLNEAPTEADPVFTLGLRADGVDVSESAGGLKIKDAEGDVVGRTSQLVAWDAKTDVAGDPAGVVPLNAELTEVDQTGDVVKQELELTAPAGFLSDPNTQYPVIIDPAVMEPGLMRDTFVRNGAAVNYSADPSLLVGKVAGTNPFTENQSMMKFYPDNMVGVDVISADLRLFQYYAYSCDPTRMNLEPIVDDWNASTDWSNKPRATTNYNTNITDQRGPACGPPDQDDYVHADVTAMADAWSRKAIVNEGIRLSVPDAVRNQSSQGRKFCSMDPQAGHGCQGGAFAPYLTVTFNRRPNAPSAVSIQGGTADGNTVVSNAAKPTFFTQVSDVDGGALFPLVQVLNAAGTGVVQDLYAPQTTSGQVVGVTATSDLPDGTYQLRAKAGDGRLESSWSPLKTMRIDRTAPSFPTVACSGAVSGQWYDTRPTVQSTCTVTGASDTKQFRWFLNNKSQPDIATTNGSASLGTLDVPTSGVFSIRVNAIDAAGNLSAPGSFGFGFGTAGTLTPIDGERTSSTVLVESQAPGEQTVPVTIEHRAAGGAATAPWTVATKVKPLNSSLWLGVSEPGPNGSVSSGKLVWDVSAETGITKPSVREMQTCFNFDGVKKCAPGRTITVVPAAFGGSFPTQAAGPGQVALFTGEFQLSETDVEAPSYDGTITLGRSHRSYAGEVSAVNGVFGPGWVADLQGVEAGLGSAEVVDKTAQQASITLINPDGSSGTYINEDYTAGAQLIGYYDGDEETSTQNNVLQIKADPDTAGGKFLVLTEPDETVTTWKLVSGRWDIKSVVEPLSTGTTSYKHDTAGLVTGIYAPAPAGVQCNEGGQQPGCRALILSYTTDSGPKRLAKIDMRVWNPRPNSAGTPGTGAGMDDITVQKYDYNTDTDKTLKATWDPRLGDDSAALKTTYEYAKIGSKTVLTKATPPGETPWRFGYNTESGSADIGKIVTVKRDQPAPLSGEAVWIIQYGTPLAGDNKLPTMTLTEVAKWGQAFAPVGAATVYGPDAPGTTDLTYGSLSYFDVEGRTTNTAAYGAGAWQIDSSVYDAKGNVVWALDEGGRATALAAGAGSAGVGNNLASITVYNEEKPGIPAGTRVEKTYGPTRQVMLKNGALINGRSHTTTTYDDEAADENVPAEGRPTPVAGAPADNLPVQQRSMVVDASGGEFDSERTRYEYKPVVTGDGDGWKLGTATRVKTEFGSGWSTTLTRFDSEGKVVETRTPQGVSTTDGAGSDARSTKTVYYTPDSSASRSECQSKPAWAGQLCWTGPGGQPSSGGPVPETSVKGYSIVGVATRTEESSGDATRVNVTGFDASGRTSSSSEATTGLTSADRAVAAKSYTYSPTTGALTSVSNGTQTQTTTYDSWGRTTSQTDGAGNTSTTTYDTAGRVKTSDDGKGTTTYTYNGTDSKGRVERRGVVTKLDAGLSSGIPDEFTGSYDADGQLIEQKSPGDITSTWTYDAAGAETSLLYTYQGNFLTGWARYVDSDSRTRAMQGYSSGQNYTYDQRDRLVNVVDNTASGCTTRAYGFSQDSNRTSLKTYAPASGGGCQTSTAGSTVSSDFDAADRITTSGYTYDALGRTKTVPVADTSTVGGGTLTVGYHANDMVATMSQDVTANGVTATKAQDYTLDASDRLSATKNLTNGVSLTEATNHYDDGSDSPAWTGTRTRTDAASAWVDSWTRHISGLDGNTAIWQQSDGNIYTQHANLHDDIAFVGQVSSSGMVAMAAYSEYNEYGHSDGPTRPARYGWLGGKQRDNSAIGGLTLMGARLYNSSTGRFLSRDPVPGGNDNSYIYPADPINVFDLDGNFGIPKFVKSVAKGAGKLAWKYKYDIALTALSATGFGAAAVAGYRTYRVARIVRAAERVPSYKVLKTAKISHKPIRATLRESEAAGKKWVAKGGGREYRSSSLKGNNRGMESNFTRYDKGAHNHTNLHVKIKGKK